MWGEVMISVEFEEVGEGSQESSWRMEAWVHQSRITALRNRAVYERPIWSWSGEFIKTLIYIVISGITQLY
jgi:hypothetical protein